MVLCVALLPLCGVLLLCGGGGGVVCCFVALVWWWWCCVLCGFESFLGVGLVVLWCSFL